MPEDPETLLIGESARLAAAPDLSGLPGRLAAAGFVPEDPAALGRDLADPDDPCVVVVAEAG